MILIQKELQSMDIIHIMMDSTLKNQIFGLWVM